MEVLDPEDVEKETKGVMIDGLRWYPRAEPLKMLRIYRMRFKNIEDGEEELKRVRIVETYLAPDYVASPKNFLQIIQDVKNTKSSFAVFRSMLKVKYWTHGAIWTKTICSPSCVTWDLIEVETQS